MIRATYGATAITRVRLGRISALGLSHGRDPGGTMLVPGTTWGNTVVASRITSTTPTTNSGSAAMRSSRFELSTSKIFSRLSAAHEPMATDSGMDTTAA